MTATLVHPGLVAGTNIPDTSIGHYAVFRRHQQLFGLTIELVREVLPGQPLTRVPQSRDEILGVLSLRGEILPVLVIDPWLGLPSVPDDPARPILVVRRADLLAGLRVDAIQGVVTVLHAEVQPHPSTDAGVHLTGIWRSEGHAPITIINDKTLFKALLPNQDESAN